jgi:DNA-binding GntR family transcriptional regulator
MIAKSKRLASKTPRQQSVVKPPSKKKRPGSLYVNVARALKNDIIGGVFPLGTQLPSEDQLCQQFSVSRHTIREALRCLRADHLVSSRQGSGTVVIPPRPTDLLTLDALSINDLAAYSPGTRLKVLSSGMELVKGTRAETIGVADGSEWFVVRGLGEIDSEHAPVCWCEHFVNRNFAAIGRLLPRYSGPIFTLIEDRFALRIVEIGQEITAGLIPAEIATPLEIAEGSAAIHIRRVFKAASDEIAQITIHVHPASRFRYSIKLHRS